LGSSAGGADADVDIIKLLLLDWARDE